MFYFYVVIIDKESSVVEPSSEDEAVEEKKPEQPSGRGGKRIKFTEKNKSIIVKNHAVNTYCNPKITCGSKRFHTATKLTHGFHCTVYASPRMIEQKKYRWSFSRTVQQPSLLHVVSYFFFIFCIFFYFFGCFRIRFFEYFIEIKNKKIF